MRQERPIASSHRAVVLARTALLRPMCPFDVLPPRLIVVDVRRQRLALIEDEAVVFEAPVSTSSSGIGGDEGSNRTPPGWHRLHARIGADMPVGTVFESREPTGRLWDAAAASTVAETNEDLILSRVLTLEGLEDGINRGPGRDSLERYIYLHGTNHEAEIGRPTSHGCVRLRNADVLELFERVREGDPVVIVEGTLGVFG